MTFKNLAQTLCSAWVYTSVNNIDVQMHEVVLFYKREGHMLHTFSLYFSNFFCRSLY